ncbi:MAG: hypothetical protein CL877_07280 [Dehalococcoidales bacterium]|jgi:nucleotidyltransferase/DNA polymerase involved in DNA repair|nr:hypothetical protein [Dehalococcoidales bacterium]|tara:strand:- start:997 stop:1344 length:348 start_codon:yes stop_codon:yes gene_type:complete
MGPDMRQLAQGRDNRTVLIDRSRKSDSVVSALSEDTDDPDALFELVNRLSQRVAGALNGHGGRGRTGKLKLRLADFTTFSFTRQTIMAEPVGSSGEAILVAKQTIPPCRHRRIQL